MRVLICPDKFAGTLSAVAVAQAIAEGWRVGAGAEPAPWRGAGRAGPESVEGSADSITLSPLSDGGPGFVDVLSAAVGGHRIPVPTVDPLGRPVDAELLVDGHTGYLESSHACGLHLLSDAERDPERTTSYGLGTLVATAVETGVQRIVLGLGGSATNDGGAGMLAALGAAPVDAAGYVLPYGGVGLLGVAGLSGPPRLRGVDLVAATDVDNPLIGPSGASAVYGPQKGASPAAVARLDAALERFAGVLEENLETCPRGLAALPGGGAAGGIGAAVLALGGRCESGIGLVRRLVGLDRALDEADLVITGEGSFDEQSLRGKVVAGVAAAARQRGVPCVVLAGQVTVSPQVAADAGIVEAHALVDYFAGMEPPSDAGSNRALGTAMRRPAEGLRELAARLARRWRQPGARCASRGPVR